MDSNEKLLFEETIQIHEDTSQPVLENPVNISREEILQKIIHSATIFIIPQYPFFLPRSELPKLFSFFPFSNGFGRMWKEEIVEICEVGRVCLSL